jgi:DNA-binding MarR family transcriptional regulator
MTASREKTSPPALNDIDRVVHEPARLMILANLYVLESADFTFLMNQTNLTWGNLSSHLSKLEEAGYVHIEKEFVNKKPHTMLSLTEEGRKAFEDYRQQMKEFMDGLEN